MELDSQVKTFWSCFEGSIKGNEGQRRILSIIAEDFTYIKLKEQLNVSNNLIHHARIHARLYGKGGQILEEDRVKITKGRSIKNNVTVSSYKTDKTGNPIYYLKSTIMKNILMD